MNFILSFSDLYSKKDFTLLKKYKKKTENHSFIFKNLFVFFNIWKCWCNCPTVLCVNRMNPFLNLINLGIFITRVLFILFARLLYQNKVFLIAKRMNHSGRKVASTQSFLHLLGAAQLHVCLPQMAACILLKGLILNANEKVWHIFPIITIL